MKRISFLLMVLMTIKTSHSFNIDTKNLVIHKGPRDTCDNCMFGFSVAQHSEGGVPWLLIGAPEADDRQPDVHRGGAVYKCSAQRPGDCQVIPFDTNGTTTNRNTKANDIKSGQWLGSLVASSGSDGTIMACAPRYIWYTWLNRRDPVGICYAGKLNSKKFRPFRPCITEGKWGYHRQGYCQAGLGAAIDKTGDQLFIGAVGSWYWQGQAFSFNTKQLQNRFSTDEGSPSDDDSYLGYSVATGEFTGDDDQDIAVGMPRGANLTGKVVLYNSNLTNLHNLTGDQIGAYFGYTIATCDINGDGLDDILIGAPMWTDFSLMGKFETGRVYVVYQSKDVTSSKTVHRFRKWDSLNGENHKARFGMSIASLGNINLDGITADNPGGYQDFAVGAPYDGPNNQGAVYIFLGSRDGVMKKPSQVIYASSFNKQIRTFGWSLSGGMDMDNNNYPDLLVGAYDSGHAVHMRSAPVVHMTASISFDVSSKQVDLENLQCQLRDRTRVPCVQVSVALKYTGVGVPDRLDFDLEYNLDSKKENQKRMFLLQQEGQTTMSRTISMKKDQEFRDRESRFKIYLLGSKIYDKLTSLDIQMKYSLANAGAQMVAGRSGLTPVLAHGDHLVTDSLNIQKECGSDNLCIPNLSVKTKKIDSYLMGSGERLEIQTEITNSGEDAFNALFEVQLPRGVSYINANTTDPSVNILCSPPSMMNNNTVQCEVGNPLRANKQVTARIYVMPSSDGFIDTPVSEFYFLINAKSSNPEDGSEGDNWEEYSVPIRVETDFRVTGKSDPLEVEYNITAPLPKKYEFEDEIGEEVSHIYDVKNKGPTSISEAEVYILWPSYNEYEDHLLYLLGFEYDNKKAFCEPFKNLNPLMVKVQGSRAYADALEMYEQKAQFSSSSSGSSKYSSSSSSSSYSSSSSSSSYSQSNQFDQNREGYGGRMSSFSDDEEVRVNIETAARGPGNYHGTMSKAELEREAGGNVFSGGSNVQVENTRYGGQKSYQGAVVADGAEETRLFDTQGQLVVKKSDVGADKPAEASFTSSSSQSSSSSSSDFGSNNDQVYSGWRQLDNGTYIRVYDNQRSGSSSSSSSNSGGSGGSNYGYGSNQYSSSSSSSSSEQIRLDGSSGGSFRPSVATDELSEVSGNSVDENSGYMNTGWIQQPDGTYVRKQSSWSSSSSSSSSGDSGYRGAGGSSYSSGSEYSSGSSGSSSRGGSYSSSSGSSTAIGGGGGSSFSGSNTIMGAAQGPGNYHGTMSRAELEREAGGNIFGAGASQETRQQVENTAYRGRAGSSYNAGESYSAGSSYNSGGSSSSYNSGGSSGSFNAGGSSYSSGSSSNQVDDNDVVVTKGGRWVWSEVNNKWEWEDAAGGGGREVASNNVETDSGSDDSGWIQLSNGTWTRKQSSWSSSSQSGVRYGGQAGGQGGLATGLVTGGRGGGEWGDDGSNSTGWVTMPDGTMVKKTSAWSSWSSSSHENVPGGGSLDHIQRQLEQRVRNNLNHLPSNVEPGFEDEYQRNRRSKRNTIPQRPKRSLAEFQSELDTCGEKTCTVIKCTIGPLEKDESVLFKVRSRLFTETQVKNYAEKVKISSKLVTRVTKLPFLVDERHLAFQTHVVTTTVIPSEPGEAGIPWWVWLLAALGGILVLAFITYCLYKCGFFKRQRHQGGPESEPLNGNANGY